MWRHSAARSGRSPPSPVTSLARRHSWWTRTTPSRASAVARPGGGQAGFRGPGHAGGAGPPPARRRWPAGRQDLRQRRSRRARDRRPAAADAPIDAYGVGTKMGVTADAPYLDSAYKLVAYAGRPVMKLSRGKATWPGAKQVHRGPACDQLALRDEPPPRGHEPLLTAVMRAGRRLGPPEPLAQARQRCAASLAGLPPAARTLRKPAS